MGKQVGFIHNMRQYFRRENLMIALLGFSSGLPILMVGSTLNYWLSVHGVDLSMIGLASLWGLPYAFKFLFAPFLHQFHLPILRRFGARKGWILFFQGLLALAFYALAFVDPAQNLTLVGIVVTLLALSGASLDVVVDAFRVDYISDEQQSYASSNYMMMYRIAMLFMGAGLLALYAHIDWSAIFKLVAMVQLGVLLLTLLFVREPKQGIVATKSPENRTTREIILSLLSLITETFSQFLTRERAIFILLFVVLYKFPDAFVGPMVYPFYNQMGYSSEQIALISKIYGALATIVGAFSAGIWINRFGLYRSLFITTVLVGMTNLLYLLVLASPTTLSLIFALTFENFIGGLSGSLFVMLLSALCDREYSITQYALLSSLPQLGGKFIASGSGFLQQSIGWSGFFTSTAFLFIPALILLYIIRKSVRALEAEPPTPLT